MYMINGVIIKGIGGLYSVKTAEGIYSCNARGIFRKDSFKPMIGDFVKLGELNRSEMSAVIDEILPRKNSLIRPAVSNVDRIVLVIASTAPAPDLLLVDKLLVSANIKEIPVVLVVNKSDQDNAVAENIYRVYSKCVEKCIMTSAIEKKGIDSLFECIGSGISVLVGQSGAGKTTLSGIILGDSELKTGTLSKKTERGKHTTRHSEIFPIPGYDDAYIIDSPGFSLFDLTDTESGELHCFYPEFSNCSDLCRFIDCSHTGEPGCVVDGLLSSGKFDKDRYARYVFLYKELKEKEKNKYK
ncbi:MAG: ribosome small subunit-dependent GTPase A [Clostridia bacterium]|nr:ribosome small subunit-dependent GTPase A [Clostridia bacterium]